RQRTRCLRRLDDGVEGAGLIADGVDLTFQLPEAGEAGRTVVTLGSALPPFTSLSPFQPFPQGRRLVQECLCLAHCPAPPAWFRGSGFKSCQGCQDWNSDPRECAVWHHPVSAESRPELECSACGVIVLSRAGVWRSE